MSHTTIVYRFYNGKSYKFTLTNPPRDTNSVTLCIDMYIKHKFADNPRRELPSYRWKTCEMKCEIWD